MQVRRCHLDDTAVSKQGCRFRYYRQRKPATYNCKADDADEVAGQLSVNSIQGQMRGIQGKSLGVQEAAWACWTKQQARLPEIITAASETSSRAVVAVVSQHSQGDFEVGDSE